MKVKGKAKQLFCMACAFVASFLVTVTAFGDSDFDIKNSNYFGTYNAVKNSYGFVKVSSSNVKVGVYLDYIGYISGTSQDGALTSEQYGFTFKDVYNVNEKGAVIGESHDVTIVGTTKVKLSGLLIKSITLTPGGQSGNEDNFEKYVYTKF